MGLLHELYQRALTESPQSLGESLKAVDWAEGKPGERDWRDHVPPVLQEIWGRLANDARITAFLVAMFVQLRAEAGHNEDLGDGLSTS